MGDGAQAVRSFIAAWSGGDARALADYFTDDATVWNDGVQHVSGREAIFEHFKGQLAIITDCDFEITAVASDGGTVFTERVDRMKISGAPVELPVAGVFEVDDAGKFTAWRDYFDLNAVMAQLAAAGLGGTPGPDS